MAGITGSSAARGQRIDISIQECVTSALRDTTSLYTYAGSTRQRQPKYTGDMPRSPVPTQDGYIVPIHFGGAVDWDGVADFIGAPRLRDESFATPESRFNNAQALQEALEAGMAKWRKFELMREAHKRRGHIYGVVHSPAEVLASEQYAARGYFASIEHPVIGEAAYPGAPFIMSETPWARRYARAAARRAQPRNPVRQAGLVQRRPEPAHGIGSYLA